MENDDYLLPFCQARNFCFPVKWDKCYTVDVTYCFVCKIVYSYPPDIHHHSHAVICTVWVKQKLPPLRLLSIFAKRLVIFNWNLAHLLCAQIYDRLPNFIQLSPYFTKLCYIKRDYPPNFIISKYIHREFY